MQRHQHSQIYEYTFWVIRQRRFTCLTNYVYISLLTVLRFFKANIYQPYVFVGAAFKAEFVRWTVIIKRRSFNKTNSITDIRKWHLG